MNQYATLAAALRRMYHETMAQAEAGKEVMAVPMESNPIPIPTTDDKAAWKELQEALKLHGLEAAMSRVNLQGKRELTLLVCKYGWLSGAEKLTDADIRKAERELAEMQIQADDVYTALINRMKGQ